VPNAKATVRQSELTRYLKAWKAAYDTPPAVHVQPDGTVLLLPSSEAVKDKDAELTALEKWKAGHAAT
jgi:hypothetical protein